MAGTLRLYGCGRCLRAELIYDASAGPAPFVVACPDCGGTQFHRHRRADLAVPDFVPVDGQRVLVDADDEAPQLAVVRRFTGTTFWRAEPEAGLTAPMEAALRSLIEKHQPED